MANVRMEIVFAMPATKVLIAIHELHVPKVPVALNVVEMHVASVILENVLAKVDGKAWLVKVKHHVLMTVLKMDFA